MFVLNPDSYLLPQYRISPFRTEDLSFNNTLHDDNAINQYFNVRFKGSRYIYTRNGREAISLALSHFKLQRNDVVTILTSTGNFYVSNCITSEIEKYCNWSREIVRDTKVILVNHEFGIPYKPLQELANKGIPIIEDCAHSFFSTDDRNNIGTVGDYVIYSFPKMFPIQIGGLLVSNVSNDAEVINCPEDYYVSYIHKVLSHHIQSRETIIRKRFENYGLLRDRFESLGFSERFALTPGSVPGVFMFRTEGRIIDLPVLKKHFYAHGIQCSVFYGEEAFFIPVHQALNEQDLDYFYEVIKLFIQQLQ